jgi:hypothetical protein
MIPPTWLSRHAMVYFVRSTNYQLDLGSRFMFAASWPMAFYHTGDPFPDTYPSINKLHNKTFMDYQLDGIAGVLASIKAGVPTVTTIFVARSGGGGSVATVNVTV